MYVGIIGRERVGKDTFADILVTEYGFKKHSMAEPIRDIAHIIFPHWQNPEVNKDTVDQVSGIRPRDFMKWLGTDVFQLAFHEKFPDVTIRPRCIWSTICADRIRAEPDSCWVIPDIRFKHEAEELQRLGGILINLYSNTPISDRTARTGLLSQSDDQSFSINSRPPGVGLELNGNGNASIQAQYDIPFILQNFPHTSICNNHDGIGKLKNQVHDFMNQHR